MGGKKAVVERVERRMQSLLDPRHINFSIFNVGMVPMYEDRSRTKEQENGDLLETRSCGQSLKIVSLAAILVLSFGS